MHAKPTRRITIASTFTAEPVSDALEFWLETMGLGAAVEFAPYNQVVPQLLDPGGTFERNRDGVHVVLARLEDWVRLHRSTQGASSLSDYLERAATDLIQALQAALGRRSTPIVMAFCPSPDESGPTRALLTTLEARITSALAGAPGLYLIPSAELAGLSKEEAHDPVRDRLGHVPYTPLFFALLGTTLARRVHALLTPPYKVVVLDCDNTLWKGVVGEDGVAGVGLTPAYLKLQEFMVALADKGFLLCLASKNEESDVLEVLDQRDDMILKRERLVSWRINWRPKSDNLASLASELNLGLDSLIFVDDNPVECAQVEAGCPGVLTLRLPIEGDFVGFLKNIWAFDRLTTTAEDLNRTAMYQQEADRKRFQSQATSIEDFLAGLELRVVIQAPTPDQVARTAQLTQRTNQFNFTTIRRGEGEIQGLAARGLECRVVETSDRFGDYGLVGVMIVGTGAKALEIDTFLLSCRVLGRGVEHQMLREAAAIARARGLGRVDATLAPTKKNQPARDFLESVAGSYRRDVDGCSRYEIPIEAALAVEYRPGAEGAPVNEPEPASKPATSETVGDKSGLYTRAAALDSPSRVLAAIEARAQGKRPRSGDRPIVAPRTETEAAMAELWAEVLRLDRVGVEDAFFDLGGTSLLAVDLFARIERRFGKALPLTTILEAPTVAQLASRVVEDQSRGVLVPLAEGSASPPLFLVHDGDGETLLYRNLAAELDRPVYGLQPRALPRVPLAHSRIEDMAADHIARIREVQPHGPYLLGGMCAGGVIAYEMARQLRQSGEQVPFVALLDAADPTATLKSWRGTSRRFQSFTTVFEAREPVPLHERVGAVLVKAGRKVKNLTVFVVSRRWKAFRDEIQMRALRHYLDRGLRIPPWLERIPVRTVYLFAERCYRPQTPLDGTLTLFRATQGEGNDEPYIERYQDPLLGWGMRTTKQVEAIDVSGGHSSMLQEPHSRGLARRVRAAVQEALAGSPDESTPREKGSHHRPRSGARVEEPAWRASLDALAARPGND